VCLRLVAFHKVNHARLMAALPGAPDAVTALATAVTSFKRPMKQANVLLWVYFGLCSHVPDQDLRLVSVIAEMRGCSRQLTKKPRKKAFAGLLVRELAALLAELPDFAETARRVRGHDGFAGYWWNVFADLPRSAQAHVPSFLGRAREIGPCRRRNARLGVRAHRGLDVSRGANSA